MSPADLMNSKRLKPVSRARAICVAHRSIHTTSNVSFEKLGESSFSKFYSARVFQMQIPRNNRGDCKSEGNSFDEITENLFPRGSSAIGIVSATIQENRWRVNPDPRSSPGQLTSHSARIENYRRRISLESRYVERRGEREKEREIGAI